MAKKRALLMVKMDPPGSREAEWNDWYNNRHVAARLAAEGFLFIRRYREIEVDPNRFARQGDAKYLALYDLASTDVLNSEGYLEIKKREAAQPADSFEAITKGLMNVSRGVYEQIFPETGDYRPPDSKFLLVVGHDVPHHMDREYNVWYNTEHIPVVTKIPGFLTARRFVLAKGEFGSKNAPKYLSLYDLEKAPIFDADIRKASATPWSAWLQGKYERKIRLLYERIYPRP
ncbi:MAG: hypothetical protein Q7R57_04465 [Dehalococcoidales bacterium]|nr:hypothetical protein [Dehalococcoidales bacterium]